MPGLLGGKGQRMGTLGTVRNFVSVLREMSFDEVRGQAELMPRLVVVAPDEGMAAAVGRLMTGPGATGAVTAIGFGAEPSGLDGFDAVVVVDPGDTGRAAELRRRLHVGSGPAPVFAFRGRDAGDEAAAEAVRQAVATALPERAPALGRWFPSFRPAAVKAVIDETAKANAQFALISNIPAAIPIVGMLAAAGADFLVLTKNQLMLLFKVAAIHGRDLHDQFGIMREMVPVVGVGLVWRTVAREAASFVPFLAGTLPKVFIAYAGTVSTGRAADYYYRSGHKPTRDQLQAYYRQAAETVKRLPLPLPGNGSPEATTSLPPRADGGVDGAAPRNGNAALGPHNP